MLYVTFSFGYLFITPVMIPVMIPVNKLFNSLDYPSSRILVDS